MAAADFVHEFEIRVPRAELHAFLCDLHNLLPLHPLIQSIEEIPATAERPRACHYRVVDRVALGPLRLRATYTAALEPVSADEVHGDAWQFPAIHVRTLYALAETATGTHVTERVWIEAPRLLKRFVVQQANRAHEATLVKMKAQLEAAPGSA
jgi:hypothetical protein